MAGYLFMVEAEETSILDAVTAPTYEEIAGAFRDANDPPAIQFIGPGPRVTRVWNLLRGTITRAAQPVKIDDPSLSEDEARQIVAQRLLARLEAIQLGRSWNTPQVAPYVPAISGPLAFWQGGDAIRSTTMNDAPSVFSTTPSENPVGPNNPALRPLSIGEDLAEYARRVGAAASGLMPVLYLAAGLLAMVYVAPAAFRLTGAVVDVGADATPRKRKAARRNPTFKIYE